MKLKELIQIQLYSSIIVNLSLKGRRAYSKTENLNKILTCALFTCLHTISDNLGQSPRVTYFCVSIIDKQYKDKDTAFLHTYVHVTMK